MIIVRFEQRGKSNETDLLAAAANTWCVEHGLIYAVDFYWFYWDSRLCFEFYDYEFATAFKLAWL
jgi:hypothetical protein